jgi:hypothetical protein
MGLGKRGGVYEIKVVGIERDAGTGWCGGILREAPHGRRGPKAGNVEFVRVCRKKRVGVGRIIKMEG